MDEIITKAIIREKIAALEESLQNLTRKQQQLHNQLESTKELGQKHIGGIFALRQLLAEDEKE